MDTPWPINPVSASGGSARRDSNTTEPIDMTVDGEQTSRPWVALQLLAGPPGSTMHTYIAAREDSKMTALVAGRSTLPISTHHQYDVVIEDLAPSLRTSTRVLDGSFGVTDTCSVPSLTNSTASSVAVSVSTDMGIECLDEGNNFLVPGQSGALETPPPPPPHAVILYCPLRFLGCHQKYQGQHEHQWLTHSLTHFEKKDRRGKHFKVDPPSHNCCPFCEQTFWALRGISSWEDRMSHVKIHHQLGHRLSVSRPDFALIEHLWQNSLIDRGVYRDLKPKQGIPTSPSSHDGDRAVTILNQGGRNERGPVSGLYVV